MVLTKDLEMRVTNIGNTNLMYLGKGFLVYFLETAKVNDVK